MIYRLFLLFIALLSTVCRAVTLSSVLIDNERIDLSRRGEYHVSTDAKIITLTLHRFRKELRHLPQMKDDSSASVTVQVDLLESDESFDLEGMLSLMPLRIGHDLRIALDDDDFYLSQLKSTGARFKLSLVVFGTVIPIGSRPFTFAPLHATPLPTMPTANTVAPGLRIKTPRPSLALNDAGPSSSDESRRIFSPAPRQLDFSSTEPSTPRAPKRQRKP